MFVPFRAPARLLPLLFLLGLAPVPMYAQQPPVRSDSPAVSAAPAITGVVSTQGDIVLGGALVSLLNRPATCRTVKARSSSRA